MLQLVLRFVNAARASGLRISSSEVLDCTRHLTMVDVSDEAQFKTVLRANFAKSHRDQPRFEHLYDLFFKGLSTQSETDPQALTQALGNAVDQFRENLPQDLISEASLNLMEGDPTAYLQAVRGMESDGDRPLLAMGGNLGQVARRLEVMLRLKDIQGLIAQFLEENRTQIPFRVRRDLDRHLQERMGLAQRLLSQEIKPENQALLKTVSYEKRLSNLGETPFVSLSPKEVEEMRAVIDHLVRKLKDTISRRYAARSRGVLDVKRTLRRSSRYHGVPIEIIRKKKNPRKGKVVTICDVSGSVWSAARFMLNMLYSVQECFTQVRSFIFVAGLAEVTGVFDRYPINQAIEKVLTETDLEYGAPTDYGAFLRQFRKNHMDILNKKTTIIIIGDGRTNYMNPEVNILDEMREKTRRIIWLNPESPVFWYTGDSEMKKYEQYCHEMRPCQNLNQLMDFIQELVL